MPTSRVTTAARSACALSALAITTAAFPGTAGAALAPGATAFAFIGDTPYGPAQLNGFSRLSGHINADPDITFVANSGDTKDGSTLCSDQNFADTLAEYNGFQDGMWYTPGDNEWTDCHRTNNGSYDARERLAKIRSLYFANPGQTVGGAPFAVTTQRPVGTPATDTAKLVENTLFVRSNVTLGAVHIVGSNNGRSLETGQSAMTPAQIAEVADRRAANLAWIDAIFDEAVNNNRAGVFIMMQAEPSAGAVGSAADLAWGQERAKIIARTQAFNKPVWLAHGDAHVFTYTPNYGGVANLTRLENYGAGTTALGDGTNKWLKVTIDPTTPAVFSFEQKVVPANQPIVPVSQTPIVLFGGIVVVGTALAVANRRRLAL
jgi:hypothetical protein